MSSKKLKKEAVTGVTGFERFFKLWLRIIYILCKSILKVVFKRIGAPPYHLLRTIIMSCNIRVGGKEYPKKRTYFLTLEKNVCGFARRREAVRFAGGVIGLKMKDESCLHLCSTMSPMVERLSLLYYDAGNKAQDEIVFEIQDYEDECEQLFIYFFDDEGGLLLYADRSQFQNFGARFDIVGASESARLRREAINVASLWDPQLREEIFRVEQSAYRDSDWADVLPLEEYSGGRYA